MEDPHRETMERQERLEQRVKDGISLQEFEETFLRDLEWSRKASTAYFEQGMATLDQHLDELGASLSELASEILV